MLVYGHFDVQPPAPIDLWDSDPFEPTIRDDWLFARGVADDKGQLYSILRAAVDLADEGALPVNIRVASDGEEEIGGMSIVDWVDADERGADVCVIFDGGWNAATSRSSAPAREGSSRSTSSSRPARATCTPGCTGTRR